MIQMWHILHQCRLMGLSTKHLHDHPTADAKIMKMILYAFLAAKIRAIGHRSARSNKAYLNLLYSRP